MNLYNYKLSEARYKDDINKLNEKIEEERKNPNFDKHKILRLEEEKLMGGLFSTITDLYGYF